jgi:hypothetical protein
MLPLPKKLSCKERLKERGGVELSGTEHYIPKEIKRNLYQGENTSYPKGGDDYED